MTRRPNLEKNPLPTTGAIFGDGSVLELVRNQSELETLNLLYWKGRVLSVGTQASHGGQQYAPAPVEPSVSRALRLPTRVAPQEAARELFTATYDLFAKHLNQLENSVMMIVYSIFATWLHEVLPTAPLLWIVAPSGNTKNTVLRLLHAVCRRSIFLGGTARADFRSLPMSLEPTLLLDEPDFKSAMLNLVQSSSRRGMNILNGKDIQSIYSPKIICSCKIPPASWLESGALRVVLGPAVGLFTALDEQQVEKFGENFQARFLGYRLRNLTNLRAPEFDVSSFTPPIQEVARTFAAPIVGDKELQGRILSPLCALDEEIRTERSCDLDAVTCETLFAFTHEIGSTQLRSSQLAKRVSAVFAGRGHDRAVSPETVGWSLKRLGLHSERLDSAANGVRLTNPTRRLVHRLALSYGVRALEVSLRADCTFCEEFKHLMSENKLTQRNP